jgi:hypothetical protein
MTSRLTHDMQDVKARNGRDRVTFAQGYVNEFDTALRDKLVEAVAGRMTTESATPPLPGTMLPDQEEPLTFIFDIPHRVEPTALTLEDGQGEEESDEVEWEIR